MLRVTKDRKRKYVSLGISVNPENWGPSRNYGAFVKSGRMEC